MESLLQQRNINVLEGPIEGKANAGIERGYLVMAALSIALNDWINI